MRSRTAILILLLAAACTAPETVTTTVAPSTTTSFDPAAWARSSLVQVRSVGDFADAPGSGEASGVVIDQGMIAVVDTAVVGAETVTVWFAGSEVPARADVLGTWSCAGIAVLEVDATPGTSPIAPASEDNDPIAGAWVEDERWETGSPNAVSGHPGAITVDDRGGVVDFVLASGASMPARELAAAVRLIRRFEQGDQPGFTGLPIDGGLLVTGVDPDSPAATSDLAAGDVITAIGDRVPTSMDPLCHVDGSPAIEVRRNDVTLQADFGATPLAPTSERSTEELVQAVVRVDTDGGTGTGFFITEDGLLVTNYHVVAGHDTVSATFDGGEPSIPGVVVGRSSCTDLAVVNVEGSEHVTLEWAVNPPSLEQEVRAIGFPRGVDEITIENGIVSKATAPNPEGALLLGQFQQSAQITGGNSGGPIIDEHEAVIGVTRTIYRDREDAAFAENYAITGVEAAAEVAQLVTGDDLNFGVRFRPPTEEIQWWWVNNVDAGSPAEAFGLRPLDIIVAFDGESPQNPALAVCRQQFEGAAPIHIEVFRDGSYYDGVLGERPLEILPDPLVRQTEDGSLGTTVSGRWTDYQVLDPEGHDWIGFRTGEEGFSLKDFFDHSHLVLFRSFEEAAAHSTIDSLTDFGCAESEAVEQHSVNGMDGHVRYSHGCPKGMSVADFAWIEQRGGVSAMVQLTIIAPEAEIGQVTELALDTLSVGEFPELEGGGP